MRTLALLLCCVAIVAPCNARAQQPELPLDRLTPADVRSLVDSSIAKAGVYRDSLLAVRGRRTVRNTLRLYDELSIAFNSGQIVALLTSMHPDSAVRAAAVEGVRRRSAFFTELRLDQRLYNALAAVDTSPADAETRYYIARVLALYRHDGVDRDSVTRAGIAALQAEIVRLGQRFNSILAADTTSVLLADTTVLGGLPGDWLKAQRRGPAGEVVVSPEDMRFVLQNAEDAGVRRQVMLRLQNRGAPGNHFVLDTLLRVRAQLATLLGHPSYAAYQLENHMAESPERVWRFLDDLQRITEPAVQRDVARAESLLGRPPQAGDFQFLVYHLRGRATARPNALRPYFPYERVRDALLHIADTLFDVQFTAAPDIPVWHPDVEAYRVAEHRNPVGIAYLDVRRRPGKPPSGSTASMRLGVRGRVLARSALLLSLPQQRPGEPVLLGSEDVASFFHEFGHLLENMVTARPWFGTSGLPAEFDFREVPSLVFERWGRDPAVLRTFARHFKTGEALPDSLVAALQQPDETRNGLGLRALLARARVSLALHDRPVSAGDIDSLVQAQWVASLPLGQATGESHPEASFTHLVGYDAAYYTYLWSAVIAEDVLSQFKSGLMDPVTAHAYRHAVLDPGRSRPAGASIAAFLGRPFRLDAWAATLGVR